MAVFRSLPPGRIGVRALGRLPQDERAQVSFSVIAVALILATAVTGAYLAKKESDRSDEERRQRLLADLVATVDEVKLEISLFAASAANRIVSSWKDYPVNESRLSSEYSGAVETYVANTFPRLRNGHSLSAANWSGGLFLVEKQTMDIVPSDGSQGATMEVEGTPMEYESLPAPATDEVSVTTASPYYVALGNLSVLASSGDAVLSRDVSFERPVVSALPFLVAKLRAFEASSEGEFSDMGKLVSYMLTTLAQLRALEGYGVPLYTGLDTAAILTEQDVYRAVAVSLLIEQARLFRAVDRSYASSVVELCGGGSLGLAALESSRGRPLDPAELFLWFLGVTEPSLDPTLLVAQAVAGMADQMVLKVMDYMGWLGLLDLADQSIHKATATLSWLVERLTGEDQSLSSVVRWISRTVEVASSLPELYTTLFALSPDFSVAVPGRTYFVESATGELYPVWVGDAQYSVEVPRYDLLSSPEWAGFYATFKECQGSLTDLVYDGLKRMAFDLASSSVIGLSGMAVDPADGKDIFTVMAERTGSVELTVSPQAVLEAGSKLPMFSAHMTLAREFDAFVSSHSRELSPWHLADAMFDDLAEKVVGQVRHSFIPDLGVPVDQQILEIVRYDLEHSHDWGVGADAKYVFESFCLGKLRSLTSLVNSSVLTADDAFAGPLVDSVASALMFGAGSVPGLVDLVEMTLGAFARSALAQGRMSSFKQSAYIDIGGFSFWDGELSAAEAAGSVVNATLSVGLQDGLPPMTVVPYDAAIGQASLEHLFPVDELLVQVKRPWDHDRDAEGYPNTHLTSLMSMSATPYSSQWVVSAKGIVALRTASSDQYLQSFLEQGPEAEASVLVSVCVPVVVQSAWPLEGVEYNPTNTVYSDAIDVAARFYEYLWDKLEPVLGWVKDGLETLYNFVQDAFMTLATFSAKVVKVVAKCIQTMVETLQAYVQMYADSALAKAVKLFVDLVGNVEFRVTVYGFTLIVRTNLPDLLFKKSQDLVRIILCTDRFGPGIAFGLRIAKLSDGRFDVVVNGTVTFGANTVEVVVDPLMIILRRFVEVHCRTESWALDMAIPEAEPYETAQATTADLPGVGAFLSNIPIPLLGVSASVEAGLRVKYSPPFPTDVVVNEFEANPKGDDSGNEWVELYNPLAEPRCVDGWSIQTMHGISNVLPIEGTIPPNGLMVFTFPSTSIDNGYPNDPFNDGDSLVLRDAEGRAVDMTPTLRDSADDDRSHQRTWDGGPRWALKQATKGDSNGPAVLMATSDFIVKSLFQAFKAAFEETKLSEVGASLDFVVLLAKRVLHHFIENLLSLVKEIVHEVVLFIKVTLADATGATGVGMRTSFVVTGDAIVDLLRWLIHSVATFVVNLGRPSNPIAYPAFPERFFSGLFLRFDVLFEVGTPRMVRAMGVTPELEGMLTCVVTVAPNLPSLGRLAGKDWGHWAVEFGVYLEGVPREYVSGFLLKDTGDTVDLWLVKGRLYGL